MTDERLNHVRDLLEQAYAEIAEITAEPAAEVQAAQARPETEAQASPRKAVSVKERVERMIRDTPSQDVPFAPPEEEQTEMHLVRRQIGDAITKLRKAGLATSVTLQEHLKEKRG